MPSADLAFVDVFEPLAITAMGVALFALGFRLYKRGVMRLPAAISLTAAGALAVAWKYPDLVFMPDALRLPFEVAEVQFFVALSTCMTMFALDAFTAQARALVRAEETLRRQRAELEKAAVLEEMAAIVDSSEDAIIGQSLDGRITSWNTAAERIYGYSLDDMRGAPVWTLVDEGSEPPVRQALEEARRGAKVEGLETICVRKDGILFETIMTLAPIRDAEGLITGVSCVARDVSESKRAEELRRLALTDDLTGLNNRRGFLALAEHQSEIAKMTGRSFLLLFADLNGLKAVNDTLGHAAGDDYIRDAAAVLKDTFRDTDILARVGGDEFCVLLPNGNDDANGAIERLQAMLDIYNVRTDRPFKLSLSIGSAKFDPARPLAIDDLMQRADEQMYANKLAQPHHRRLLVVDDDPSVCSLLEVLFSDDYDVVTAGSGRAALSAANEFRPDLVLLDLHLPDMTGIEVAQALRNNVATRLVPIIMITGAGHDTSETESLRAGVDDYVEKPFDEDALRARMENVLKRTVRRR